MELTEEQFQRYARHLILDEVGEEGQEKLLSSRVLVVGAAGRRRAVAVRRAAVDLPPVSRRRAPVLPLPVPRAAAAGPGAALRGGGDPRRSGRRYGHLAGGRGAEGTLGPRRQPRRHAVDL